MANRKNITLFTAQQIQSSIPDLEWVGETIAHGGQKTVYLCIYHHVKYALKLIKLETPNSTEPDEDSSDRISEIRARVRRELDTMKQCNCHHLVKIGPIPLGETYIGQHNVLYYVEEWIEGENLQYILKESRPRPAKEVCLIGQNVALAIKEIASRNKIHRDVKPANIMQRAFDGSFVLLDLGLLFDLSAPSITKHGWLVGTYPWFSPEQFDFSKRRSMDFRSDLFSLGIVMYQAAAGKHPFWTKGQGIEETCAKICSEDPPQLSAVSRNIPALLDRIVMKLLAKKPHLRYSSCDRLLV